MGIFDSVLAGKILSGEKIIDARFSKSKIAPFGQISVGDLVYVKPSGKDIIGQFRVKKVLSFEGLELSDLSNLSDLYENDLGTDPSFWEKHSEAKYGTLIFIERVVPLITSPITLGKKDMRGWVVLE